MAETNKMEVVISGIAGVFPESDNVEELKDLLFGKRNGITLDSRRWPLDEFGVPSGVGKVKNINLFDNVFFSIHGKLCENTEDVIKLNLERSVEAIIDAGLNPGDLYDTNTAVFTCSSVSETDTIAMFDQSRLGFGVLGHNKAMQANRLSYSLNLNGPSFTMFSSFTGGADAIAMAKHMIEKGHIRTAIIGSCNLVIHPNLSLQLKGLGVLNDGIETRAFSDNANGFNRSESCVAIILQNSLDAKRSYGTILGVKMEQFGDLRGVFTNYSAEHYKQMITELYAEVGVDPADVTYVEADGCAIKDVDAMELDTIKDVFCSPRRKQPLMIGSIKSNIGHTDVSSGLVSIIKAVIAMDTGYIPPNINYTAPNSKSDALTSGHLQVVTEKTPLAGDIVGLNIFGRTGNYGHIILKKHDKPKKKTYAKDEMFDDGLPRLILVSGRNDAGVRQTMKTIEQYDVDEEYVSLLHKVFSKNISAHFSRSFFIIPTPGPWREKDVYSITNEKPPVWFVFSGMGSQWLGMGLQLLRIPVFAKAVEKCDAVLRPKGIDITDVITSLDPKTFDNILNSFVGIAAIQIGLVDVLRALDIEPDGMIGHSVGELGCAYADGCFTAEEMIEAAYARGRASLDTPLPDGMMAAVGLGYASVRHQLPDDVDVACHNSSDSCTLSGPTRSVVDLVDRLKANGVFAKPVNVSNISFHSRYIQPAAPALLERLKKIVPDPKPRSPRWLSTSVPESQWDSDLARYCSAEYHTNNLLNPVLFEETCAHVPKNAVVIEIAPHGLLQAILKRSLRDAVNIPLTQRVYGDSVRYLLTAIGKMYCNGLNPNIEMLYSPISYPVAAGTPPLHTLCSWNHEEEWQPIAFESLKLKNRGENSISLSPTTNESIEQYEIHGHHVLPLSALLFYVWESFVKLRDETELKSPIVFQDVHYYQHVAINKNQPEELCSAIQAGTGRFELCLNNKIVLCGNVFASDTSAKLKKNATERHREENGGGPLVSLARDEVYSTLEQFGCCVGDAFKTIRRIDIFREKLQSDVQWDNNWTHYLDAMLQLATMYHAEKCGKLVVPVSIQKIYVDPTATAVSDGESKDLLAQYNIFTNVVTCDGVEISLPRFEVLPLDPLVKTTFRLGQQRPVRLASPGFDTPMDFVDACVDIALGLEGRDGFENVFVCPVSDDSQDRATECYARRALNKTKGSELKPIRSDVHANGGGGGDHSAYIAVTRVERLSHAIATSTAGLTHVHAIVVSNGPASDGDDYSVVMQQRFGDDHHLSLVKKISKADDDDAAVVCRLSADDLSRSDRFQNVLAGLKTLDETIYMVCTTLPPEGVLPLAKTTRGIKNIRFFFVLDDEVPEFSAKNPFYSEQLAKGLSVNVYRNGEWVTYREVEFANAQTTVTATTTTTKKTLLANLSNTTVKDITVKYIGLNPRDASVNTKNSIVEYDELGPIEYSGLTSCGHAVMGVAPFVATAAEMTADPVLSWPVPENVSLEEASTIPVPYSMAYYTLTVLGKIIEEHSVLVHYGLTAVGQAAIDVCLERKCRVFVTVSDSRQMELLKQRFPSLPCANVIIYDRENFEIKFLMANNKMDVIINCLDGEDFYATVRVIADHGKFFQLTKSDMKKEYKMGLLTFLRDISFYAVGMERIIDEADETKTTIRKAIERGLRNGTVKPFDRCVLTGACTGVQALETLEKLTREDEFKRVVISTSGENNAVDATRQFQCFPDRVYIVIGNGSDDWLCLTEWLAQRGALKLVVALQRYRCLTPAISRKFNILMDRYKGITVQLVPQSSLDAEQSARDLLTDSTTAYPLAAVLFASAVDEKSIENAERAMTGLRAVAADSKPLFACLLCGGGAKSCETLRSAGAANAVCLSWAGHADKPGMAKVLHLLDDLLIGSATLTDAVVVCSDHSDDRPTNAKVPQRDQTDVFLPRTVDELARNSKYTAAAGEPDFVEVATKSVLYADAKGAYPVFVVPGFRPEAMKDLYNNLGYPTFEARYPTSFGSVESVAEALVKKLRHLTEHNAVTLIGESWGGAVALVMAQLLESQGVLVSLSLLNGVPSTLVRWANDNFASNNNVDATLLSKHLPVDDQTIQLKCSTEQPPQWDDEDARGALNTIRTQLDTLLALKPLPNKLLSIPHVFVSSELSGANADVLDEFCFNPPVFHVVAGTNSRNMLKDPAVIKTINENVAFDYPHSSVKSLDDKYNQHYFSTEVSLIC